MKKPKTKNKRKTTLKDKLCRNWVEPLLYSSYLVYLSDLDIPISYEEYSKKVLATLKNQEKGEQ